MEVYKIEKTKNSDNKVKKTSLNVAAYCRVSTDLLDQFNSLENQQRHYEQKINSNPNWNFVAVYSDEGISGTNANKRDGFLKMIIDADEGMIDLILVKSISRFARNTVDVLNFVRYLTDRKVGIIFEEENLNTLTLDSELLLTILGALAQQESENLSSHIKMGRLVLAKRGDIKGNLPYGYYYDKETKIVCIDKEKKINVEKIFKYFLEGQSILYVAKMLKNEGIKTPRGKEVWDNNTIKHLIENTYYIGDAKFGKTYINNPIDKKSIINKGEREMVYVKDHHEPIIDKELFDKCNKILKENYFSHAKPDISKNIYKAKLRCGICNTSLSLRDSVSNYYSCNKRRYSFDEYCINSYHYPKEVIDKIVRTSLNFIKHYSNNHIRGITRIKRILTTDYIKRVIDRNIIDKTISMIQFGNIENNKLVKVVFKNNDLINRKVTSDYFDRYKTKYLGKNECEITFRTSYYDETGNRNKIDISSLTIEIYIEA